MKVSSSLAAACYAFAQSCAALEQIAFDSLLGGDTEDLAQARREEPSCPQVGYTRGVATPLHRGPCE